MSNSLLNEHLDLFDLRSQRLFFVKNKGKAPNEIRLFLEKAEKLGVDAIYFKYFKKSTQMPIPQVYIFNYTNQLNSDAGELQKNLWCDGQIPLSFVFYREQVKILNNLKQPTINKNTDTITESPLEIISLAGHINTRLKISKFSAKLFDSGEFWNSSQYKSKFKREEGSYELLLKGLKRFRSDLLQISFQNMEESLSSSKMEAIINKLLVLCIFVKYLEEKEGADGDKVFQDGFFNQFGGATDFIGVLRSCQDTIKLFNFLGKKFNGKIFHLTLDEKKLLKYIDLTLLADFLDGKLDATKQYVFWRLYSFNFLPIELISNIYEEFLVSSNENQKKNGAVYTPPHLVQFLIDEAMPVDSPPKNITTYKVLDPSCGSGIFLVGAFKRIIQWWQIKNQWEKPEPKCLTKILSNSIYGVDINDEAVNVAIFSLSLTICDMLTPKVIWEDLKFEDPRKNNFIAMDFFELIEKSNSAKDFDLVIGNPPFKRKKTQWGSFAGIIENHEISSDSKRPPCPDIAILFFEQSLKLCKENALVCLLLPSGRMLYNNQSVEFRNYLIQKYRVPQIIDFTYLNRVLFGKRGDISTCAVFASNTENDGSNILHVTVKRTKSAKEKLFFDLDYYDFHRLTFEDALTNRFIWKANLLGGGRLGQIALKLSSSNKFESFIKKKEWGYSEGRRDSKFSYCLDGKNPDDYLDVKGMYSLHTPNFTINGIDKRSCQRTTEDRRYINKKVGQIFLAPHILIKEVIEEACGEVPCFLELGDDIVFKERVIGIHCPEEEKEELISLFKKLKANEELLKLYIALTSGEFMVATSSSFLKKDLDGLPWEENKQISPVFTDIEKIYCQDIFNYILDYKRNGETSRIFNKISSSDSNTLALFGKWYCKILNNIYKDRECCFQPEEPILNESFICYPFFFGQEISKNNISLDENAIEALIRNEYESICIHRIIKYYEKNRVYLIKPNESRYWLESVAIRDADDTFADFVNQGF